MTAQGHPGQSVATCAAPGDNNAACESGAPPYERREQRRLTKRLSMDCAHFVAGDRHVFRTVTVDVSALGVCFETRDARLQVGDAVEVTLHIPPGEGHCATPGTMRGTGQVLRVETIPAEANALPTAVRTVAAVRFDDPPTMKFG